MNWAFWRKRKVLEWGVAYLSDNGWCMQIRIDHPNGKSVVLDAGMTDEGDELLVEFQRRWNSHKDAPRLDGT